ncbi:HAD hydrolase-like protein [Idiomarina sp.]|uniref:HAD family hydrolase n=1 Tax=Idiomarina sp. TaxID=1874361 RepID=UPI002636038D|nr:HAD hydrolase-like protein [Idiomarina sp.]
MRRNLVQAVIFDLDDTLVSTSKLAQYRENGDREGLKENIARSRVFDPVPNMLRAIENKGIPLALVSNSPRWYIDQVLEYHNIELFDVIVAYDDVGRAGVKPSGRGIELALEGLELTKDSNVIYVGDKDIDFVAAYHCNVKPIAPSWATTHPIDQVPAAILNSTWLLSLLDDYDSISLIADRTALERTFDFDKRQLNFIPLNEQGQVTALKKENIRLIALGRYFSQASTLTASYHEAHQLSKDIFAKEESETYVIPQYYVNLMAKVVESLPKYAFENEGAHFDIVTVIPAKKGKNPRLENFLRRIEKESNSNSMFIPDIFEFSPGATSLKTLGGFANRQAELKNKLHLKRKYADLLAGKSVLVIDDVLTTGASFGRSFELLEQCDSTFSMGVCLAKTVSVAEELGYCPECDSLLQVKTNSNTGIHFIGCTGFYETGCKYSKSITVAECPQCGDNIVKRFNSRDKSYFYGCEGYGKTGCTYKEPCEEI